MGVRSDTGTLQPSIKLAGTFQATKSSLQALWHATSISEKSNHLGQQLFHGRLTSPTFTVRKLSQSWKDHQRSVGANRYQTVGSDIEADIILDCHLATH